LLAFRGRFAELGAIGKNVRLGDLADLLLPELGDQRTVE